ncbi:MAG TPA: VWA domain-containing protein [Blastocatellia bacterium]|nr:VWA domain-containing protein [Blastocatellia bacterium]
MKDHQVDSRFFRGFDQRRRKTPGRFQLGAIFGSLSAGSWSCGGGALLAVRAIPGLLLSLSVAVCMLQPAFGGGRARGAASRPFRKAAQDQDQPIRLRTTLVQVPVVVSDEGGRYITDLNKNDFQLFEDGSSQTIELFASIDQPFSVELLLDSSGSTMDQLNQIKAAALAFISNLRATDRVMVISFDDSVHIQCDFTNNRETLRRAVESVAPGQFTQVYEAVYTAVWEKLHPMRGRKAVIVFTDGIDTASSEISQDDTLDAVSDSEDVLVYPIRYSTRGDVESRMARDQGKNRGQGIAKGADESAEDRSLRLDRVYRAADEYLQELAGISGGVLERADTLNDLNGAFARIADELRHQYLLGYYPTNRHLDGSDRRITVRVARPGVRVRARPSYRAAS